jgi:hypothetical protein
MCQGYQYVAKYQEKVGKTTESTQNKLNVLTNSCQK